MPVEEAAVQRAPSGDVAALTVPARATATKMLVGDGVPAGVSMSAAVVLLVWVTSLHRLGAGVALAPSGMIAGYQTDWADSVMLSAVFGAGQKCPRGQLVGAVDDAGQNVPATQGAQPSGVVSCRALE